MLNSLKQGATELTTLRSSYEQRSDENAELKKQLTDLDNHNKTLKSELEKTKTVAGNQARKLTVLEQTGAELSTLKNAYKERNDEAVSLREQLAKLDNEYKTLKAEFSTVQNTATTQARKLTA